MKIFNLQRGNGKTIRMLYASEFNNAPILCKTDIHKNYITNMAKQYKIDIPEPITVYDITQSRLNSYQNDNILVDDMECILKDLLKKYFGFNMIGGTITINNERGQS